MTHCRSLSRQTSWGLRAALPSRGLRGTRRQSAVPTAWLLAVSWLLPAICSSTAVGQTKAPLLAFENVVVRAEHCLVVSAEEAGCVADVLVDINESVAAGTVLLKLDSQPMQLAVEQAQDELHRSQAMIEKAKAVLARAKTSAAYRREDVERHAKLGQSINDAERRKLQEAVDHADVEHVIAYNDLLQMKHVAQISEIRLRSAELGLQRMQITAPTQAEVTALLVDAGERVEAGQPVAELRAMQNMLADFQVPEATTDVGRLVRQEVAAEFEVAGDLQRLSGRVVSCDSEVNARGLVRLHVRLENRQHAGRWLLFHGKSVTLRLTPKE